MSYFELKIKLRDNSVMSLYKNHSTYHKGDAGLDLFCLESVTFEPNSLGNTIKFGIQCEMIKITEQFNEPGSHFYHSPVKQNISYMLVPCYSISKTPLRMSNSIGIIDSGYRGEIMAKVDNLSNEPFTINKGDRLFQLINPELKGFNFRLTNKLSSTDRGTSGFGSTNK